jgi:hypothetical protein
MHTDPTHSAYTVVGQTYVEANNFTNADSPIYATQDGKWDFSIIGDADGYYCFRAVKSSGSLLDTYTYIPEISLPPSPRQFMRHGKFFSESGQAKQPFYW